MRRTEQILSLFWIAFALWVCTGSSSLELGDFSNPGPGFLPFGTGALLGVIAIVHLAVVSVRAPREETGESPWKGLNWKKGLYVILALFSYVLTLPRLGYLTATFLLMIFLFSILERRKWWTVLFGSLFVIAVTYFVFEVWLMVQFPRGIF